jgi:putative ATPase
LVAAIAAAQIVEMVAIPNGRLVWAQATVHLTVAAKSTAVIVGIDEPMSDVSAGAVRAVPAHLRYGRYTGAKDFGKTLMM